MKKLDYKWVIAGLCFIMVFTCLGFCSSTRSLFVVPITTALKMNRSVYSLTDSFRFIAVAIINVFFGFLVSKFGTRKLIGAGFVSLIASMSIYATADKFWQFYIAGILLGIGFSWTTTTMVGCVVNRWCKENRGTIMGAILAANGLGGAVATTIVSKFIENGDNEFAYRKAYWFIAAVIAAVGTIVVIFFRERPKNATVAIKTENPKKKGRGTSWVGIPYKSALKKPYFYLAAVCIMLTGAILQGITGSAGAQLQMQFGVEDPYVSLVLSVHSIFLAVFKFGTGVMYDKFGLRTTVNICTITSVVVMVMLAFVTNSPTGRIMAMVYGIFSSLALPLETIMLPIYASDLFGDKSFDKVLGVFVSVNSIGYAIGSVIINGWFDIFGSYKGIFLICSGAMVIIFVTLQYVMTKARKQRELVESNKQVIAES